MSEERAPYHVPQLTGTPIQVPISEATFTDLVIEMAQWAGWRVYHSRPGRRKDGTWNTPIQGNPGFPDLVLAKNGVVIFAELKTEKGIIGPEQNLWLYHIGHHQGATAAALWRPRDLPHIRQVLGLPPEEER